MDARLITNDVAKLLAKVRWLKPIRMACDSLEMIDPVLRAVKLLRKYNCTPKCYFIYVLVKDIDSALKRVNTLKENNLDPFAQPYRSLDNKLINRDIKSFARYVNHKAIFKSVSWLDYKRRYKL